MFAVALIWPLTNFCFRFLSVVAFVSSTNLIHPQYTHPAWEGFDISKLHEEYAKLEAEKQAYLAAKAGGSAGGSR